MNESDCLFCGIVAGRIPADIIYSDDDLVAFRDINPVAPLHLLVIPRKHLAAYSSAGPEDDLVLGRLARRAGLLAAGEGYGETGFRVVVNKGPDAGQSVDHLHLHVLAGRPMGWPPWPTA